MRLKHGAALLVLACGCAQAQLGWIIVDENPAAFPPVSRAAYDPKTHTFTLDGPRRYHPPVNRDQLIEIFSAIAASPLVQTRLDDRFTRKGGLAPQSNAMHALRAAAWHIRRQAGLLEENDWSLHLVPPRFHTHNGKIQAIGGSAAIVRIWGRLPVALPQPTPQIATGNDIAETIAFARGLKSHGIALAPLVAAMEGPAPSQSATRVLVLAFEPYGGRALNASAIAAQALVEAPGVASVQILPVEWDRAAKEAIAHINALKPDLVLALGEHAVGWFHIETLVYNLRWRTLADNTGQTAPTAYFAHQGPPAYDWPGRPYSLAAALAEKGFPLRVSRDPGREQCASVLYALAARQEHNPDFHFTFLHVPRVGQPLAETYGPARCTQDLLRGFAHECLREIRFSEK